jgi:hypothetical protein
MELDKYESLLISDLCQRTDLNLDELPQDKWPLLSDLTLRATSIRCKLRKVQHFELITRVIKNNNTIKVAKFVIEEMDAKDADELGQAIQLSQLCHVTLNRNSSLTIAQLLRSLKHASALKTLEISFKPNFEEFYALAEAVENPNLECFEMLGLPFAFGSLQYDQTTTEAMNKLITAICNSSSLRGVHVRELYADSINVLFETVSHNQIKLERLAVTYTVITEDNMRVLSAALKTTSTLTSLQFTRCDLVNNKMKLLSDGLRHNNTLKSLKIEYNNSSMSDLCDTLKVNSSLTKLDLTNSYTNDEEAIHIADMLERNTSLAFLSLASNKLENAGISCICQAMAKNKSVLELRLESNKCGVEGMTSIKHMLTLNNTLRHFNISFESDSKKSIELLYEGLKANTTLSNIAIHVLFDMQFENLRNQLNEVLEHNYALDTVNIRCLSHFHVTDQVPELLIRNRQLKSATRFKVAILSHNIARSHDALSTLPQEIWESILSSITHPGMEPFKQLVKTIFNSYNMVL